jgi:CheY-like chemotaxis protein/anti-sigma regulatory factor (Ser/Thr protein kinase)
MACQFMKRKSTEDDPAHGYIQMIEDSSNGIQTLIGDILDYSKLDQGSVTLHETEFDLLPLLESVTGSTRLLASKKNVEVKLELCSDLPDRVSGDPGRIRQILGNLLSNAVKFTQEGYVELRARAQGKNCYFEIADTGIGIAEDALERIFQPYQQADSTILGKFGGTGLGLNICDFLVKKMGGQIEVESTLGEGSLFRFHIELPGVVKEDRMLGDVPWNQLQVWLLADSCPDRWLSEAHTLGLRLQHFKTSQEVAERAVLGNPDVMLFSLENGGFLELGRILNCFTKKTPRTIATTSLGQRGDGARCKALGVNGYLTTPFCFEEVKQLVQLVIHSDRNELVTKHTLKEQGHFEQTAC